MYKKRVIQDFVKNLSITLNNNYFFYKNGQHKKAIKKQE